MPRFGRPVVSLASSEVSASLVASGFGLPGAEFSVDVSVLALSERPGAEPSDVPPGRSDVDELLVFSGEPFTSSMP